MIDHANVLPLTRQARCCGWSAAACTTSPGRYRRRGWRSFIGSMRCISS